MANIPSWSDCYGTPQQYREHMDAHTKAHQKFLEAQRKPGYVPVGMQGWINSAISRLPKDHPKRQLLMQREINGVPLSDEDRAFIYGGSQ